MKLSAFDPTGGRYTLKDNEYFFLGFCEYPDDTTLTLGFGYNSDKSSLQLASTVLLRNTIKPLIPEEFKLSMPSGISFHKNVELLRNRIPFNNLLLVFVFNKDTSEIHLLKTFKTIEDYDHWVYNNSST